MYYFYQFSVMLLCGLSNLFCVFFHVDQNCTPRNGMSTRNFLISSMDLGSASKFTLAWYCFSNRSLKIVLLQISHKIKNNWINGLLGEEGHSANQNAKFQLPDNKNDATFWRMPFNQWACRIPVKIKPHVEVWHNADKALLVSVELYFKNER